MVIGVRSFELHLAGAHSLKEKRSVIKSLKDRLHNEFNVSVAETGRHDAWQSAEITVCLVSTDRRHAESVLESVDRLVAASPFCRVVDTATSFL
jgi:uncharacterized protein YlxP (DUF503 family)